jgi:hypothetical protein
MENREGGVMWLNKRFERVHHTPPHDRSIWVRIIVEITDTVTGEKRCFANHDALWDEDNNWPHLWIWEGGNFSCDCNRGLFFHEHEDIDYPCGEERFVVNLYDSYGDVFYKEEHEEENTEG